MSFSQYFKDNNCCCCGGKSLLYVVVFVLLLYSYHYVYVAVMPKDFKQTEDAVVLGKKRTQPLAWKTHEEVFDCSFPSYRKKIRSLGAQLLCCRQIQAVWTACGQRPGDFKEPRYAPQLWDSPERPKILEFPLDLQLILMPRYRNEYVVSTYLGGEINWERYLNARYWLFCVIPVKIMQHKTGLHFLIRLRSKELQCCKKAGCGSRKGKTYGNAGSTE